MGDKSAGKRIESVDRHPNIPPIFEQAYGYDRVSNVLSAYDNRPGAGQELSHEYDYDDLHRLKEAERGLYEASATTFTKKKDSQFFALVS